MLGRELGRSPSDARALIQRELVSGITRVNYNQPNSVNALTGMVSMVPIVHKGVWKVRGGNSLLPQRLLARSGATLNLNTVITEVRVGGGGRTYEVTLRDMRRGTTSVQEYDAVIIATPLELSNLTLPQDVPRQSPAEFQRTVTTYVKGSLLETAFNCSKTPADTNLLHQLGSIYITEAAPRLFSAISVLRRYSDSEALYKLFSEVPLGDGDLERLFHVGWEIKVQKDWQAYPVLSPAPAFRPFRLRLGLYYVNALEWAASAMEVSALAARNVATLLKKDIFDAAAPPPAVLGEGQVVMPRFFYLECPWKILPGPEALQKQTSFELRNLGMDKASWRPKLAEIQEQYGFVEVEEQEIDVRVDSVAANAMVGWDGKVSREHFHHEFEVRCVLEGEVVWDVRSKADRQLSDPGDRWIRAHVYAGECAYIPKGVWHRMFVPPNPGRARFYAFYTDKAGWTAKYRNLKEELTSTLKANDEL